MCDVVVAMVSTYMCVSSARIDVHVISTRGFVKRLSWSLKVVRYIAGVVSGSQAPDPSCWMTGGCQECSKDISKTCRAGAHV